MVRSASTTCARCVATAASCSAEDEDEDEDECVVSQCTWVGDTDRGMAEGRDAEVADGRHGEARVATACDDNAAAADAAAATSKW